MNPTQTFEQFMGTFGDAAAASRLPVDPITFGSNLAVINGHNITTSMDKVRRSLGLCPQHNMLFEDLTVREHLRFFGMVRMKTRHLIFVLYTKLFHVS